MDAYTHTYCGFVFRQHTAVKISPRYSGATIHVLDASKSVVVVRYWLLCLSICIGHRHRRRTTYSTRTGVTNTGTTLTTNTRRSATSITSRWRRGNICRLRKLASGNWNLIGRPRHSPVMFHSSSGRGSSRISTSPLSLRLSIGNRFSTYGNCEANIQIGATRGYSRTHRSGKRRRNCSTRLRFVSLGYYLF